MNNDALSRLNSAIDELQVTAQENPAVHHCCSAYLLGYAQALQRGDSDAKAVSWAAKVYRLSLPPLRGSRNIQDFIACVTHGTMIGAIDREDVTRLLYAAQVAHTARRTNTKTKTKTKNTVQEPVSPPKKTVSKSAIRNISHHQAITYLNKSPTEIGTLPPVGWAVELCHRSP